LMGDGPPAPPPEDPVERFWLWIDDDSIRTPSSLLDTLHHVQTFWDRRADDNIVLLHYADLKADLDGQMRQLAARLRIDVPEDKWPALVEAAQFANMKAKADTLAPQVTDRFWKGAGDFFKSGTSGQWRSFFTDADEARYAARAGSLHRPTSSSGSTADHPCGFSPSDRHTSVAI